jgi:hypothetical protein
MWVLVSEEYCVVQQGSRFFVCKRATGRKVECLHECASYSEAYSTYRLICGE